MGAWRAHHSVRDNTSACTSCGKSCPADSKCEAGCQTGYSVVLKSKRRTEKMTVSRADFANGYANMYNEYGKKFHSFPCSELIGYGP